MQKEPESVFTVRVLFVKDFDGVDNIFYFAKIMSVCRKEIKYQFMGAAINS